jgi:hypothetical protein
MKASSYAHKTRDNPAVAARTPSLMALLEHFPFVTPPKSRSFFSSATAFEIASGFFWVPRPMALQNAFSTLYAKSFMGKR